MARRLRTRLAAQLVLVLASAAAQPAAHASEPAAAAAGPSKHRVAFSLGFSHWFGPTFGSPDGYTTPMFAVGVRPFVPFLEIKLRFTRSAAALPMPDGSPSVVSFGALELLACRELRVGPHSLNGFIGALALLDHTRGSSFGGGFGAVLGAEYLIRTGLSDSHAFGLFVATHEIFYALPDDRLDLLSNPRRDAQIDIGLITTLL